MYEMDEKEAFLAWLKATGNSAWRKPTFAANVAVLIADALDVINPDDADAAEEARMLARDFRQTAGALNV